MRRNVSEITPDLATRLLREHVSPGHDRVTAVRVLPGGYICHVYALATVSPGPDVVAKMSPTVDCAHLREEFAALNWYRARTQLPVPRPLACVSIDEADAPLRGTWLFMQRAVGNNLEVARISPAGRRHVMAQLAGCLVHLHSFTRKTYGSALGGPTTMRWLDRFEPMLRSEVEAVRDQLSSRTRTIIDDLLPALDAWLPEAGQPTLIHGDLWAANIIVDDGRPDRPRISAFIDLTATFSQVEFELAYLRVFRTIDRTFVDHYARHRPLRRGFNRRCRIYWLYFMLQHLRLFGTSYLKHCERLAGQIEQMGRRRP